MIYTEGAFLAWRMLVLHLAYSYGHITSPTRAAVAARVAAGAAVRRALLHEPTTHGPVQAAYADGLAWLARQLAHPRSALPGGPHNLVPVLRPSELTTLEAAIRDIAFLGSVAQISTEESAVVRAAVEMLDPVMITYAGERWEMTPPLTLAALVRRTKDALADPEEPHGDWWDQACTYASGEGHRATGYQQGAQSEKGDHHVGRASEV